MGMNADTAALRAAAQRLVDSIEDDEHRSGGLLSRISLKRAAELQRILFETRLEEIITERAERRERVPSEMTTTSTALQRKRAREKTRAHFSARERERRLATARIVASDAELIAQAMPRVGCGGFRPGIRTASRSRSRRRATGRKRAGCLKIVAK